MAPPLWVFLNLESKKKAHSAVKFIDFLSIADYSLALQRVARGRRVASFEANALTDSEAFFCPLKYESYPPGEWPVLRPILPPIVKHSPILSHTCPAKKRNN